MVVFNGHKPKDETELRKQLRGINDSVCWYDDLSWWQKIKMKYKIN